MGSPTVSLLRKSGYQYLLRLLLLLTQLLLGNSCSYCCDSGGRQAGRWQRHGVYS